MSTLNSKLEKIEDILGNIDVLVGIIEKDMLVQDSGVLQDSGVQVEALSNYDKSCLLSAIKMFTQRGNFLLDEIDGTNQQVNR